MSYQFNGSKIAVTDTGRSVLGGKADHITLNGLDRWIGGVHLLGHRVRWRWDERIREIVSQRIKWAFSRKASSESLALDKGSPPTMIASPLKSLRITIRNLPGLAPRTRAALFAPERG